jgi:hypothetical protein
VRKKRAILSSLVVGLALLGLLSPVMADRPQPQSPTGLQAVAANDYFDSDWLAVPKGTCKKVTHGLGGDPNDYAVELLFLDKAAGGLGIHRRGYGGLDFKGKMQGGHWQRLTDKSIELCRGADADLVDWMRVRVFVPTASGQIAQGAWKGISPGTTKTYNHNLNISSKKLVVGLWFKDTTAGPGNIGIHQLGYGGLPINATKQVAGAHWHNLTSTSVQITRHASDKRVGQFRFTVVEADPPDYDSLAAVGWQAIAPGSTHVFKHNLNWDPEMLLVRGECYWPILPGAPDEWGIHNGLTGGTLAAWAGGEKGANLQRVGDKTVEIRRWPDDDVCPKVRVRIWKRSPAPPVVHVVYVPLAVLNDG